MERTKERPVQRACHPGHGGAEPSQAVLPVRECILLSTALTAWLFLLYIRLFERQRTRVFTYSSQVNRSGVLQMNGCHFYYSKPYPQSSIYHRLLLPKLPAPDIFCCFSLFFSNSRTPMPQLRFLFWRYWWFLRQAPAVCVFWKNLPRCPLPMKTGR